MSLLEKTQHLYKKIREKPLVDEIRDQVIKFKPKKYGISDKLYPMRLIGLLTIDPKKVDNLFSNTVFTLVNEFLSWDEKKRNVLLGINNQVFKLNELCIAPLTKVLPHYSYALNPYSHFLDFLEFYKLSTSIDDKNHLFNKDDAKEIADVFYKTPAFEYALSTLSDIKNNPLLIHSEQSIVKLNENLLNAGPRDSINLFGEFGQRKLNTFDRHTISLLCIKDALSNLNQLIYQAIIQNELRTINMSDVIDYELSSTDSGSGVAIKYLISKPELWAIELCDIITLKLDWSVVDNCICRIESYYSNTMSDNAKGNFDDTVDIAARIIDENLNAYGSFIHKISQK